MLIAAAKGTPWYADATLWVAVCVISFLALLLWKGAFKAMGGALDERAEKIEGQLDEARRLREEAQALLASYQRKQKEAEEQAEEIVAQARKDAESMAARSRAELKERLTRRAVQAEAKIANAEKQALADVRARAAELAINGAEDLLKANMKAADHTKMVKEGIEGLGKALN